MKNPDRLFFFLRFGFSFKIP